MVRRDREHRTLTYKVDLPGGQSRLKDLVLYVSAKCRTAPRLGLIKLNKIIWRADFRAFERRGLPVSGRYYQRLKFGPAPIEMPPILAEMAQQGLLEFEITDFGFDDDGKSIKERRPIPLAKPSLQWFSPDDLVFVDESIDHYWNMTGMETSDDSHGIAWRTRSNGDPMPYESSHLSDETLDGEILAHLAEIGRERGWSSETAETWHVSKGGEARTVHTSKTSANAIDKAVKKYSNALRRLAKK